ncbi:MAG: DUF177 domain-containing protein [Synergistaceae bacterium]|nr:DUF177 domain-containing protein [Synergistaceae bacterium]
MSEEKRLKSVPENWSHRLVLSAVPKDGEPFEENFSLSADAPIDYWAQLYKLIKPLDVDVEASRVNGRLLVQIKIATEAETLCSRCLEPARVAINGELRYLYSLRPDEHTDEENEYGQDGEAGLILLDSWEDEIDLSGPIWEVLITSLPSRALCSENCRGLCPQCGANLNKVTCGCKTDDADPRFDVLRSAMKNERND